MVSGHILLSCKYNDTRVLIQNFKAVDHTRAELHVLKVENWMCVHIRSLFPYPITYRYVCGIQYYTKLAILIQDPHIIKEKASVQMAIHNVMQLSVY